MHRPKRVVGCVCNEGRQRGSYETVAYLKHLDVRNEPKMVLFENIPALNGKKSEFPMFYNPWVSRQYVADSLDMGDIKALLFATKCL